MHSSNRSCIQRWRTCISSRSFIGTSSPRTCCAPRPRRMPRSRSPTLGSPHTTESRAAPAKEENGGGGNRQRESPKRRISREKGERFRLLAIAQRAAAAGTARVDPARSRVAPRDLAKASSARRCCGCILSAQGTTPAKRTTSTKTTTTERYTACECPCAQRQRQRLRCQPRRCPRCS